MQVLNTEKLPIKIWSDELEGFDDAIAQVKSLLLCL